MLPLTNVTEDHRFDYLSRAVADEVWRTLGYARSLSLRAPEAGRKYAGADVDLQKPGRELRAELVVSGRFL